MLSFKSGDWGYTQDTVSVGCYTCRVWFVASAQKWIQGQGTFSIRTEAEQEILKKWNTRHGN